MACVNKVFNIYKYPGETPLACLERLKVSDPALRDVVMTYAGRLDPMAEGVLLVLAGDMVHAKERYLRLNKVYECEVLFGVGTDTHDCLGLITEHRAPHVTVSAVRNEIKKFIGTIAQEYPAFSSKTLRGTPLFALSRSGRLDTGTLPKHSVQVMSIKVHDLKKVRVSNLRKKIAERILRVKGDFRQNAILRSWKHSRLPSELRLVKCRIRCGSGFYVRTFARDLGKSLGCPALAFSIRRLSVGRFISTRSLRRLA